MHPGHPLWLMAPWLAQRRGRAGDYHDHREASCGQRSDHGPLVPARGFEDDQRGRHALQPGHQGSNTWVIVGHRPACAGRAQGNIALGFGPIKTNKGRWGIHNNS